MSAQQPVGPGQGYAKSPPQHPDRVGVTNDQYGSTSAAAGTGTSQAPTGMAGYNGGGVGTAAGQGGAAAPAGTGTGASAGAGGISGPLNSIPGAGAAKMFGGRLQHVAGQLLSDEGMKAQGVEREARGRELRDAQEAQEVAQAEALHQQRMTRRNVV